MNNEQVETKEKNKNIVIGVLIAIIIMLCLILIIVLLNNKNTDTEGNNNTNNPTQANEESNSNKLISIVNPDYEESMCGVAYYTPELLIDNGKLYAVIDKENDYTSNLNTIQINNKQCYFLADNIEKAFFVEDGSCNYTFSFVSDKFGKLYYINNFFYSYLDILELTEVTELSNIEKMESREYEESIAAYAFDSQNNEYMLYNIIDKYSKLKF